VTGVIYSVNGSDALKNRQAVISRGTGMTHWSAEFFGPRDTTMALDHPAAMLPHALVTDMAAGESILPHFHGIAQFQIFSGGAGSMGRHQLRPLMVQFKDHHAAYGPVVAGPQGLTFYAMRMQAFNSAPVYLDKPGYREKLKPSKRRNLVSPPLVLSTAPVLAASTTAMWEPVYAETYDDGLAAQLLRLGRGMTVMSPSPQRAGGLYLFVVNGSLEHANAQWPLWSMLALDKTTDAIEIRAGEAGLELLVLEFPHETT
jgi:hypothetical protein